MLYITHNNNSNVCVELVLWSWRVRSTRWWRETMWPYSAKPGHLLPTSQLPSIKMASSSGTAVLETSRFNMSTCVMKESTSAASLESENQQRAGSPSQVRGNLSEIRSLCQHKDWKKCEKSTLCDSLSTNTVLWIKWIESWDINNNIVVPEHHRGNVPFCSDQLPVLLYFLVKTVSTVLCVALLLLVLRKRDSGKRRGKNILVDTSAVRIKSVH